MNKLILSMLCILTSCWCFATTFYVDAARPDDAGDGLGWGTAKKTIQAAVEVSIPNDAIVVTNGVYAPIVTANRVLSIRSVNGASTTIIDGGGTNRCAKLLGSSYLDTNTVLVGFTLLNGNSAELGGGTLGGGSSGGTLSNCILKNNFASSGGGSYRGTLNNCTLTGNSAIYSGAGAYDGTLNNCTLSNNSANLNGGGADGCTLNNCTLTGNSAHFSGGGASDCTLNNCMLTSNSTSSTVGAGGGSYGGILNNCTLTGNTAGNNGGGGSSGSWLNNCIVWNNHATDANKDNYVDGVISYSCLVPLPAGEGNISADPKFVEATNGNYRLMSDSPCMNVGNNAYVTTTTDLEGKQRIIMGIVDMGAYETIPAYTITFDPSGGNVTPTSKVCVYGTQYGDLPIPERPGYTFDGWYTNQLFTGNSVTSSSVVEIASDHTLYAKWMGNSYTLDFQGYEAFSRIITNGFLYSALPSPAPLQHFTFDAWYTGTEGSGVKITSNLLVNVVSNQMVYAHWIGDNISVTFNSLGGSNTVASTNKEYTAPYGVLPLPLLGGIRFEGWWTSLTEGGVQINSNSVVNLSVAHTLFAKWNINDILGTTQVTWQATDSYYWPATTNVIKTRPFSLRSAPIIDSQSSGVEAKFLGPCTFKFWWNVSSEDGCDFLSYTVDQVAQNSISGYNAANPGQGIGWTQQQLSLPAGEHVIRWTYHKDDSVPMGSDCGWLANVEYTPIVTVAFDAQGGVASTNQKVVLGFSPYGVLPTAAKQGYSLAKWETSEGQQVLSNTVVAIITNHTLFARWTTNQYVLTFNGQGATPSPASKTVIYDSPYGSLAAISRTGYAFGGWFTQTNGNGQQILSETSVTIASNHSFYAKWSPNTYSVTFDPQNGTVDPLNTTVTYGLPYGTLPTPARTGYSFGGWFTQVSGGGTQVTNQTVCSITADQTLYAKWTARTFTLTFDGQGSTPSPTTKVVTYDASYGALAAVSKTGYSFVGWFTLPSGGGVQITNETIVTAIANHTVYAAWNPNTYTVVFDGQGGSVNPTNILVTYGMPYGELPSSILADAVMDSWWTQPNGKGQKITASTNVAIISTQTLYAKWDINSVLGTTGLVWSTDGSAGIFWTPQAGIKPVGSSLAMQSGSITNTQNTWISTTVTGPGLLTFCWAISAEVNKDIMTFKTNGSVCKTLTSKTVNWTNETVTLGSGPCTLRWSFTNDITGVVNSNAAWLADVSYIPIVTVTFNAVGGVASTNEKAILGYTPYGELPAATKTGYTFNGWRAGTGQLIETNTVMTILTNHTLFAQWTTNQYLVTFDGQGEIPSPDSKTVSYDSPYGTMPSISKTGYACSWFTATNGGGQQVTATNIVKITSNQALYAKWTPLSFTVTFNGQGGIPAPTSKQVAYDDLYGAMATVSRAGYNFEGWFTEMNGGGQQVTSTTLVNILANQTLYAKWIPKTFIVTFDAQGGTPAPTNITVEYDAPYGTLATATRTDYNFDGWYTAVNGGGQLVTGATIVKIVSSQTLYAKWSAPFDVGIEFSNGQAQQTLSETNDLDTGSFRIVLANAQASRIYFDFNIEHLPATRTNIIISPQPSGYYVEAGQEKSDPYYFSVVNGTWESAREPYVRITPVTSNQYVIATPGILNISNVAPSVLWYPPATGDENTPVTFDWSDLVDVDEDIARGITFRWNFGDFAPVTQTNFTTFGQISHTYTNIGDVAQSYPVTLTIQDPDRGSYTLPTHTITISPAPKPANVSVAVNRSDLIYQEGDTTASYRVILSAPALQNTMVSLVAQYVVDNTSADNSLGLSETNNIIIPTGLTSSVPCTMSIKDGTAKTAFGILIVPTITNVAALIQYPEAYSGNVIIENVAPGIDTVPTCLPTTSAVVPYNAIELGKPFTFHYLATDVSVDVNGTPPITVEFQFEDGTSVTNSGAHETVIKTFTVLGGQFVTMIATDKDGGQRTVTFPITIVPPLPPSSVTIFDYPVPIAENNSTTNHQLTIRLSQAPITAGLTNPVVVYLDVTPATNTVNGRITVPASVTFYSAMTNRTVNFTVQDGAFLSSTNGFTITPRIAVGDPGDSVYVQREPGKVFVQNVAPVIQQPIDGSTNTVATVGQANSFAWLTQDVAADLPAMQLLWDWGDGTTNTTIGFSGSIAHTYLTNSQFAVSVTATDKDGASTNITFSVTVIENSFAGWLDNKGILGVPADLFAEDRNGDGIQNGFEYAFGTNLPLTELLLNIRFVNGRMVVDIPKQDMTTAPFVSVELKGSTNLTDWTLQTIPAQNTTGKPSNRDWYESSASNPAAFFRLKAELR